MGLLARVIGVFVSPRATYAAVAARPRWFGVLAVTVLLVAGGFFIFLSTEVGQQAVIDQQLQFMESLGLKLNDTQVEQMESRAQYARYTTAAGQLVGMHSSWDSDTANRHGVPVEVIRAFFEESGPTV